MKRLLAIGGVALLAACGAAHPVAQTLAPARPHAVLRKPVDVKAVAQTRKRVARRETRALLHLFVPPPGSSRTRPPRPYQGFDISALGGPVAEDGVTIIRSQVWRTLSYSEALAWVQAHVPAGFSGRWEGRSTDDPTYNPEWWDYSYSQRSSRVIDVAVTHYPDGRVVMEVDASATWIYPRSPQQVAPPATREIDIRAHKFSAHVTNPERVRRIVHWFNHLLLGHLYTGFGCNEWSGAPRPHVDFVFRSASGARLATASSPVYGGDGCDPIDLTVGKKSTLLADRLSGPTFVHRVGRMLGVRFAR